MIIQISFAELNKDLFIVYQTFSETWLIFHLLLLCGPVGELNLAEIRPNCAQVRRCAACCMHGAFPQLWCKSWVSYLNYFVFFNYYNFIMYNYQVLFFYHVKIT